MSYLILIVIILMLLIHSVYTKSWLVNEKRINIAKDLVEKNKQILANKNQEYSFQLLDNIDNANLAITRMTELKDNLSNKLNTILTDSINNQKNILLLKKEIAEKLADKNRPIRNLLLVRPMEILNSMVSRGVEKIGDDFLKTHKILIDGMYGIVSHYEKFLNSFPGNVEYIIEKISGLLKTGGFAKAKLYSIFNPVKEQLIATVRKCNVVPKPTEEQWYISDREYIKKRIVFDSIYRGDEYYIPMDKNAVDMLDGQPYLQMAHPNYTICNDPEQVMYFRDTIGTIDGSTKDFINYISNIFDGIIDKLSSMSHKELGMFIKSKMNEIRSIMELNFKLDLISMFWGIIEWDNKDFPSDVAKIGYDDAAVGFRVSKYDDISQNFLLDGVRRRYHMKKLHINPITVKKVKAGCVGVAFVGDITCAFKGWNIYKGKPFTLVRDMDGDPYSEG